MTTAATSLLGLALPVTGELSGTWGDTVNTSITSLLDSAVAGTTTLSADADVTLTTTTLAANQAREAIILWTAAGTLTRYITAPAQSKTYVVLNKSSTQSIVLRGAGPTTGVTVLAGKQAMVAWDGTDFVEVSSGYVDGPASATNTAVARFSGTDGKTIQNSVVLIADTTGNMTGVGTLSSGAITSSALTATRVPYAGTAGLIQDSANMTFNGTVLTSSFAGPVAATTLSASSTVSGTGFSTYLASPPAIGGTAAAAGSFTTLTTSSTITFSGGTANGVTYLNGSKVLTSGTALTFDGTNLGIGATSPVSTLDVRSTNGATIVAGRTANTGTNSEFGYFSSYAPNASGTDIIWNQIKTLVNTATAGSEASSFVFSSRTAGSFTEKMRLDSSGSLGLGVTPSAWSRGKNIEMGWAGNAVMSPTSASTALSQNAYFATSWKYGQSGIATALYEIASGGHTWYNAPSGTVDTAITFTQAMTLDASGRLGIGTTSPSYKLDAQKTSDGIVGYFRRIGATINPAISISANETGNTVGFGTDYAGSVSPAMTFSTQGAERMRLDASGNLLVGTTSTLGAGVVLSPSASTPLVGVTGSASSGGSTYTLYSTGASAYRFYVNFAGTVFATSTTITAISDQRLKENIRDLDDGLNTVMALKPRKFDWKEGKGKDIKDDRGFIAQEFEQVLPDMIEEWKDPAPEGEEPYKAVNANLIPTLVKAIQEQQAMIEELKTRLAAAGI